MSVLCAVSEFRKSRDGLSRSARLLYLHDGSHGEGVLLSESRVWVEPGQVRSRRDTVVFEEWSVFLCLSSTILNL